MQIVFCNSRAISLYSFSSHERTESEWETEWEWEREIRYDETQIWIMRLEEGTICLMSLIYIEMHLKMH